MIMEISEHWQNKMGFFCGVFNSQYKSPKFVQKSQDILRRVSEPGQIVSQTHISANKEREDKYFPRILITKENGLCHAGPWISKIYFQIIYLAELFLESDVKYE